MNHQHIKEVELAERYLMGRLPPEETAEFEAHFVDCMECADHLETTRAFLDGLRIVAGQRAADGTQFEQKSLSQRLTRYRLSLAFAAGVILLAFGGLAIYQIRHSRAEAELARNSAAEWQVRYENALEAQSAAEKENEDSERKLRTEIAQLHAELESGPRGDLDAGPRIHILTSTRGTAPSGSMTEIRLSGSPRDVILWIPLEGETGYVEYRARIADDRQQSIWQSASLRPNEHGSLSIRLNSRLFKNGAYTVVVEGISADKSQVIIGKYSILVRRSN